MLIARHIARPAKASGRHLLGGGAHDPNGARQVGDESPKIRFSPEDLPTIELCSKRVASAYVLSAAQLD